MDEILNFSSGKHFHLGNAVSKLDVDVYRSLGDLVGLLAFDGALELLLLAVSAPASARSCHLPLPSTLSLLRTFPQLIAASNGDRDKKTAPVRARVCMRWRIHLAKNGTQGRARYI